MTERRFQQTMLSLKKSIDEEDAAGRDKSKFIPPPHSWFGKDGNRDEIELDENDNSTHEERQIDDITTNDNQSFSIGCHEEVSSIQKSYIVGDISDIAAVGAPRKSPSWRELSSQVLPAAAKELLSTTIYRLIHAARLTYAKGRWKRDYSDLGNPYIGYFRGDDLCLPSFSNLPWVDRQLVREWRTIGQAGDDDDEEFNRARTLVPEIMQRQPWKKRENCFVCRKLFGPALLRHHCRMCGNSFCHEHSRQSHPLHHLGYDPNVPERVCLECKTNLSDQSLSERIAWRLARCRDFFDRDLTPYFETGIDTLEDVALRIAHAAISMARSIPLGAQAHVAVETVDVLRKYGLKGIYGLILRKEFLAAADLLCRACDINQDTFPLSVHELSAAIFYALAQHRAKRGMDPEREYLIHAQRQALGQYNQFSKQTLPQGSTGFEMETLLDEFDQYDVSSQQCVADFSAEVSSMIPNEIHAVRNQNDTYFPVCDGVSDEVLNECIQYAPIALNFIYVERNVDMQLLAAQQGWRLLYSHLEQEPGNDLPGSALFVHEEKSVVCFAVRGTATINDVVTDLRQVPVPFPESESEKDDEGDDWTAVFKGHGLAVCGMARAANNLFREHIGVLELFALRSYKIRIVGHSLGAAVATLLGALVKRHLESIGILSGEDFTEIENSFHVYGFASPSCVDATLSDYMQSFVTSVVLHDDVVPRLTPTSIRGLMKHLLHIRETWVQKHLKDDLDALKERAKSAWAPRWRSGFTLKDASGFCRKHLQYRKEKNRSEKKKKTQTPSFQDSIDRTATTKSRCVDVVVDGTSSSSDRRSNHEDYVTSCTPKLLVEFMGGINNRTSGMVLDGDAFFDTQASLLEEESDNSSCDQFVEYFATAEQELVQQRVAEEQVEKQSNQAKVQIESFSTSLSHLSVPDGEDLDDHSAPVMLDETPLPRMFLPGKIIHIYTHRGVYKAAFVPRTFRELRHISMAGNMLSDHTSKAYFEALKEVRSVRAAQYDLPKWTAFDEDDTCSCCASRFTWASTSDSEAQEARDKHNCRSCGTLCCDPCSRNRVPLPRIGLMIPVRVCDRCYHDMGGSMLMENSIDSCDLASLPDSKAVKHDTSIVDHQKNRRSAVVDELASRIHSSVTVFN